VRERYADYDAAVAQYNGTLSEGLKEIANAVSIWRGVDARDALQSTEIQQIAIARDNARRRYEAGLANKLPLLDREFDLVGAQRRGADFRAQRFVAAIELNRAVGGGFSASAIAVNTETQPPVTGGQRTSSE
jgi:outer membrane protein TolC